METADYNKRFLVKLPEIILYLLVALLLIDQGLDWSFSISFLKKEALDLRISVVVAILTTFVITFGLKFSELQNRILVIINRHHNNYIDVLESSEMIDLEEALQKNKEISLLTLSGTKIGALGNDTIRERIADTDRVASISILLANPFSQNIITRYNFDEPRTYECGLDGIKRRLVWLYETFQKMSENSQKKLIVRVFNNYPVVSLLRIDNDIFSTAYGYKLRGGDCPRLHVKVDSEYGRFLLKHFRKIYDDSITLDEWIETYKTELSAFFSKGNVSNSK